MNSSLQRKELIACLVDLVNQGVSHDRLDDAEQVLACLRVLRPTLLELDTFDAWIAIKRGQWTEAIGLLRGVDNSAPNWTLGKALLAFCQFATGDATWRANANEVLEDGRCPEALGLIRLLVDPDAALAEKPAEADEPAGNAAEGAQLLSGTYMRA